MIVPAAAIPLVVVLVLIGAVLGLGRLPRYQRIVRCQAGHCFTTIWVPGASFKAARLLRGRWQRCPVGRHWTMVRVVDPGTLSADQLAAAQATHDLCIP